MSIKNNFESVQKELLDQLKYFYLLFMAMLEVIYFQH